MKFTVGNTVQGKRRTKSYKIHKVESVPKEDWIRVENTHEAIIEKAIFYKVQNMNKEAPKISQKTKKLSVWAGLLKCADCKMAMNKKSSTNKSKKIYEYYICSTYRKKSNKLCTKHTIKVESLTSAVLEAININIKRFSNLSKIFEMLNDDKIKIVKDDFIDISINKKELEITKISNFKMSLYEDWKSKIITKDEYLNYKHFYEEKISNLKLSIDSLRSKKLLSNTLPFDYWLSDFKTLGGFSSLSRFVLLELVNCIFVENNGNIVVKFNFEKP